MAQKTPAYIESRILFLMGKDGLPRLHTRLYDRSTAFPAALTACAESGGVGKPVVCCVTDDNQWTLLGTEGIAGGFEGHESVTRLDAIRAVDLAPRHGDRCRPGIKQELAESGKPVCLEIRDAHGAANEYCFATVAEQSAFWNIIKRLTGSRLLGVDPRNEFRER
jgi:hypothetical protein